MATMQPLAYDPQRVVVSFGSILFTGFAKDSKIEAERSEDSFIEYVGTDGDVSIAINKNKTGTVKVHLSATSPTNTLLSAFLALAELTGVVSDALRIADGNGTTLIYASQAMLKKWPTVGRGKEIGDVEWGFFCPELTVFVGGSFVVVA